MNSNAQQPINTQSVQQQVAPVIPAKSSFPKILITIFGVVIIGLIGGAYYLGSQRSVSSTLREESKVNTPTPSIMISPTSNALPTTAQGEWQAYIDRAQGISFLYPNDWGYDIAPGPGYKFSIAFGPGLNFQIPRQTEPLINIWVTPPQLLYSEEVTQKLFDTQIQRPITISGLTGVFISGENTQPGPAQGISGGAYILPIKNHNLTLGVVFAYQKRSNDTQDYASITKRMIESLKILNN